MSNRRSLGHQRDLALLSLKNIRRRPLLTALTTLGIAIGITAIVAMLSLTTQVQRALTDRIDRLGHNMLLVLPIDPARGAAEETLHINPDVLSKIGGVESVGVIYEYADGLPLTQEASPNGFPLVIGLSASTFNIAEQFFADFQLREGHFPDFAQNGVIISASASAQFNITLGDRFGLAEEEFTAVGLLDVMEDRSLNNALFINIETLWRLTGESNIASTAWIKAEEAADQELLEADLNAYFAQQHQPYSIQTSERLRRGVESILEILTMALLGVGVIALLVGVLGLMNTMFMAVIERTREIGVYLALGATGAQILKIFVVEAMALGLMGGLLGIIFGFGLSASLLLLFSQAIDNLSAPIDFAIALIALLGSMALGALGGLIPALRAASIPAADALRYE